MQKTHKQITQKDLNASKIKTRQPYRFFNDLLERKKQPSIRNKTQLKNEEQNSKNKPLLVNSIISIKQNEKEEENHKENKEEDQIIEEQEQDETQQELEQEVEQEEEKQEQQQYEEKQEQQQQQQDLGSSQQLFSTKQQIKHPELTLVEKENFGLFENQLEQQQCIEGEQSWKESFQQDQDNKEKTLNREKFLDKMLKDYIRFHKSERKFKEFVIKTCSEDIYLKNKTQYFDLLDLYKSVQLSPPEKGQQ